MWISSGFDLLDARHAHCRPFPREFAPGKYRDAGSVSAPPPRFFSGGLLHGTGSYPGRTVSQLFAHAFASSLTLPQPKAHGPTVPDYTEAGLAISVAAQFDGQLKMRAGPHVLILFRNAPALGANQALGQSSMKEETPRLQTAAPSVSAEQCTQRRGGGGVKIFCPRPRRGAQKTCLETADGADD